MAKVYTAPTLTKIGSFEEITKGNFGGRVFDRNLQAGQPSTPNIFS